MFKVNFQGTLIGTYLCFFARIHLIARFFPKNTEELHNDFYEKILLLKVINSPKLPKLKSPTLLLPDVRKCNHSTGPGLLTTESKQSCKSVPPLVRNPLPRATSNAFPSNFIGN